MQMNQNPDRHRWLILGLLVASTFLNYLDRQVLSVVKPLVKAEFGFSDSHYSLLVSAFMAGYIVMYPISGRLVDIYGSRRCMLVFVSVWSLATLLTGFAGGLAHLLACRLLLGLAEPGNYPAALRATAVWFRPEERGFPTSMFSAGSAIGAIVAPPLIGLLAQSHGWRGAFVIPGALSLVWIAAWWFLYREPQNDLAAGAKAKQSVPWRDLLRNRVLWGLVTARLLSDPVWYFLLFWFPGYI
jgi:ACS family hexuronate transporter-like MFS transporter